MVGKSLLLLLVLCYAICCVVAAGGTTNSHNNNSGNKTGSNATTSHSSGIHIFKFDFKPVATPLVVCFWVLLASLAKIGEWFSQ